MPPKKNSNRVKEVNHLPADNLEKNVEFDVESYGEKVGHSNGEKECDKKDSATGYSNCIDNVVKRINSVDRLSQTNKYEHIQLKLNGKKLR